jgi:hypothetical protein
VQIGREMRGTEPGWIRVNAGRFKLRQLPHPLAY